MWCGLTMLRVQLLELEAGLYFYICTSDSRALASIHGASVYSTLARQNHTVKISHPLILCQ